MHRKRALEEDVEVGVDEPTTDPKSPKRAKSGKEWDAQRAEEDRLFKVIKAKHLAQTQLELDDVNIKLQQARAAKQRMYEEGEMKLREIDEQLHRGRAVRHQAITAIFESTSNCSKKSNNDTAGHKAVSASKRRLLRGYQ